MISRLYSKALGFMAPPSSSSTASAVEGSEGKGRMPPSSGSVPPVPLFFGEALDAAMNAPSAEAAMNSGVKRPAPPVPAGYGRKQRQKRRRRDRANGKPGSKETEKMGLVAGPILRHNKTLFAYGNFDPHYAQRHSRHAQTDPRLKAIVQTRGTSLFAGSSILDIGCNSGAVSLQLAAEFGARDVVGVDIDCALIGKALRELRRVKREGRIYANSCDAPADNCFPISCVQSRGIIPYVAKPLEGLGEILTPAMVAAPPPGTRAPGADSATQVSCRSTQIAQSSGSPASPLAETASTQTTSGQIPELPGLARASTVAFPHNIEFRAENALLSDVDERRGRTYDVVLCFQITKWAHLNWGDNGVKNLFHRCYRLLREGGTLVLEPHDWKSYEYGKRLLPNAKKNKSQIALKPQDFEAYLVGVVGFQLCETLRPGSHAGKQLQRPVYLYRKPHGGASPGAMAAALPGAVLWNLEAAHALHQSPPSEATGAKESTQTTESQSTKKKEVASALDTRSTKAEETTPLTESRSTKTHGDSFSTSTPVEQQKKGSPDFKPRARKRKISGGSKEGATPPPTPPVSPTPSN